MNKHGRPIPRFQQSLEHLPLCQRLRAARENAGFNQEMAAKRSGIGAKSISSFETGERIRTIKLFQLLRLLKAYGCPFGEFFAGYEGVKSEALMVKLDAFRGKELQAIIKIDEFLSSFPPDRARLILEFVGAHLLTGAHGDVRKRMETERLTVH